MSARLLSSMKPRVLYVDDERFNLLIFKQTFADSFSLQTASSAKEALVLLQQQVFDVLITDQQMPEQTGLELLAAVQRLYPSMKRWMLTAYGSSGDIHDAIQSGLIEQHLEKPFDATRIQALVSRIAP